MEFSSGIASQLFDSFVITVLSHSLMNHDGQITDLPNAWLGSLIGIGTVET